MRRGLTWWCGAAVVGAMVLAAATPALALGDEERAAGLWYVDALGLDELQAQGLTGEGVTIAVIDSGINTEVPELAGADIEVKGRYCFDSESPETILPADSDDLGLASHGTNVVASIVGNGTAGDGGAGTRGVAPNAEIWFYAAIGDEDPEAAQCLDAYDPETEAASERVSDPRDLAVEHAVRDGADVIVITSGLGSPFWEDGLLSALKTGVPIVVSTPNPDGDLNLVNYPLVYNGVVAVSGIDSDGALIRGDGSDGGWKTGEAEGSSNLAFLAPAYALLMPSSAEEWAPAYGYGTSFSTPMVAATIALGLQKYPDATANQILQAMMRTTGEGAAHEPAWSGVQLGYGAINPAGMLAVDPTGFPDENPLLVASADDPRCMDPWDGTMPDDMSMCYWARDPLVGTVQSWEPRVAEDPVAEPGGTDTMRAVLLGGGIAFGVILLAGIAVAIVLPITIRRKRLRKQQTTTPYASGFPAAHQPEYPGQRAADHVNEEQWRHPNE